MGRFRHRRVRGRGHPDRAAVRRGIDQSAADPAVPEPAGRAAQTLVMFSIPLVFSIFLLVPGQPAEVLAGELIGTGILVAAGLLVIDARAGRSVHETRYSRTLSRIFPAITS